MKKNRIAAALATLVAAAVPALTIAAPPTADAGTLTQVRGAATTRHTFDVEPVGNVGTRAKVSYRVPRHGRFLKVTKVWGKYNAEGSYMGCDRFRGFEINIKFHDNRKVHLRVPCDHDTVNSASKKLNLKFYAQDPCPIGPVCPPAARYRIQHELDMYGQGNPDWNKTVFIA